jgi:hypothetical protein
MQRRESHRALIHWLDTNTGQHGFYLEKPSGHGSLWEDDDGRINPFIWEEGNYACDCNRALCFFPAARLEFDAGGDLLSPCGDGRYRIVLMKAIRQDGTIIPEFSYSEVPA